MPIKEICKLKEGSQALILNSYDDFRWLIQTLQS